MWPRALPASDETEYHTAVKKSKEAPYGDTERSPECDLNGKEQDDQSV